MQNWRPGDPERRKSQVRCQGEVFNQISELREGQQELFNQMKLIISHFESEKGHIEYHMKRINSLIEHHSLTLFGDGTKAKPGNCHRIDNLEEIESNRRVHLLVLWGAVVTSAVKTFWDVFTGK